MAHLFLAHNLLGHLNTTITTIEFYFMWCMIKKVKVHLGYWLAHSCHKIAHHPIRHLYACYLVRAYLIRNVIPRMTIPKSTIVMCKDPEWFDKFYFLSIGIVKGEGESLVFCKAEQSEEGSEAKSIEGNSEPEEAVEVETHFEKSFPTEAENKTTEVKPRSTEEKSEDPEGKWQRIIEFMIQKFGEANEKQLAFLTLQNENMNQAISLIERMSKTIKLLSNSYPQPLPQRAINPRRPLLRQPRPGH